MGSQTLIHRGRKGSYETFEPGSTLDMRGNLIGATPFQEYHIDGTLGDDNNDGLAWGQDSAFATIGKFMTVAAALGTRGRVRGNVAPGGYTEDVVTPLNTECPFGVLRAWSPTTRSFGAAWIVAETAATFSLIIRARGWAFEGFEIGSVANGGSVWFDGSTANSNAAGTELRNMLMGGWGAAASIGIDITGNGAPLSSLYNMHFDGYLADAIRCSESGTDQPRFWDIDGVTFVDNANHMNMNPRGFKESRIRRCDFIQIGANRTATKQFDNTGGANCIVGPHNVLSGVYDDASGGYQGSGSDDWAGNYNIAGLTAAEPT
jgi:hypothetical protein